MRLRRTSKDSSVGGSTAVVPEVSSTDQATIDQLATESVSAKKSSTTFIQRLRSAQNALYLGDSHAMERAGIGVTAFSLSGLVLLCGSLYGAHSNTQDTLNTKASYTTTVETSQTHLQVNTVGVYSNKAHTKSMVLMKFDDPTQMSTDANQYQAFITGSNDKGDNQPLASAMSGSVYVFGTTGYIGVYLVDSGRFPSQITSLTMRAKSQIVTSTDNFGDDDDEMGKTSFDKYDQWREFFNAGATGTTKVDALESDQPNLRDLYYQMVVKPQEASLRSKLDTDLNTMRTNLTAMREYTKSLTDIKIPGTNVGVDGRSIKVPSVIAGDKIVGSPADPIKGTGSSLKFEPKTVLPQGFNFDWRDGSVNSGYLQALVPAGTSTTDWLSAKSQATNPTMDLSKISPAMTDGGLMDDLDDSNGAVKDMRTYLNLLTQSYSTYLQNKTTYQVTDLGALLNLESDLQDVETNHSVNSAKTAVMTY